MSAEDLTPYPPSQNPPSTEEEPAPLVLDGDLLVNADEHDRRLIAGWSGPAGLSARVVVLVRGMADGPQLGQLRAVGRYRLRQAPRDVARLGWFFLRGHGRWIVKGWRWATHGDLRADARAARLTGDQQARRTAQETLRADAQARWAKVGRVLHRVVAGALLVAFLAGVLALVESLVPRAAMSSTRCSACWPWWVSGCSKRPRSGG